MFIWMIVFFLSSFSIISLQPEEVFPENLIHEDDFLKGLPKTPYVFTAGPGDFLYCQKHPVYSLPSRNKVPFRMVFRNTEYGEIGDYNNAVLSYFLETHDTAQTIMAFEKGYSYDPLFLAFLYNLGRLYFIEKKFENSIFYFQKFLYFFPEYSRVHFQLGRSYYENNNPFTGESHFRKAISLAPDTLEYYVEFIKYLEKYRQKEKANLYARYVEERFPDSPFAKFLRVETLFRQKKYYPALQTALEISPDTLPDEKKLRLLYIKYRLFEKTGNLREAISVLQNILGQESPDFFREYPKSYLRSQLERLEKLTAISPQQ